MDDETIYRPLNIDKEQNMPKKNIGVRIEKDLWQQFHSRTIAKGKNIRIVLPELIQKYLEETK